MILKYLAIFVKCIFVWVYKYMYCKGIGTIHNDLEYILELVSGSVRVKGVDRHSTHCHIRHPLIVVPPNIFRLSLRAWKSLLQIVVLFS